MANRPEQGIKLVLPKGRKKLKATPTKQDLGTSWGFFSKLLMSSIRSGFNKIALLYGHALCKLETAQFINILNHVFPSKPASRLFKILISPSECCKQKSATKSSTKRC